MYQVPSVPLRVKHLVHTDAETGERKRRAIDCGLLGGSRRGRGPWALITAEPPCALGQTC